MYIIISSQSLASVRGMTFEVGINRDNWILGTVYRNGYGKISVLEMLQREKETVALGNDQTSVKFTSQKNSLWGKEAIKGYFSVYGVVVKVENLGGEVMIHFASTEEAQRTVRVYDMMHAEIGKTMCM